MNVAETPTAEFTRNPDWQFPQQRLQDQIAEACGAGNAFFLDASAMSRRLLGDALYGNLFLLGAAWQKGLLPLSLAAIDQAIEGLVLRSPRTARPSFGTASSREPGSSQEADQASASAIRRLSENLDETMNRRVRHLDRVSGRALRPALPHTGRTSVRRRNPMGVPLP